MHALAITKKCLFVTAAAAAITTTLCACGTERSGEQTGVGEAGASVTKADAPSNDYVAKEDLELRITAAPGVNDPAASNDVTVPVGTHVSVLETKVDPRAGTLVRLGLDVPENGPVPSDAWFPFSQALMAGLVSAADTSASEEEDDDEDEEDGFLTKAGRSIGRKMTYCYAFVKKDLLASGRVSSFLPGVSAYMAAGILPKYGFHVTGHNGSNAGLGEVCVYSGGNGNNGHIEIRKAGGWWYGYGLIHHPISLTHHKLIACFNK